jgi:hypothetical protein
VSVSSSQPRADETDRSAHFSAFLPNSRVSSLCWTLADSDLASDHRQHVECATGIWRGCGIVVFHQREHQTRHAAHPSHQPTRFGACPSHLSRVADCLCGDLVCGRELSRLALVGGRYNFGGEPSERVVSKELTQPGGNSKTCRDRSLPALPTQQVDQTF